MYVHAGARWRSTSHPCRSRRENRSTLLKGCRVDSCGEDGDHYSCRGPHPPTSTPPALKARSRIPIVIQKFRVVFGDSKIMASLVPVLWASEHRLQGFIGAQNITRDRKGWLSGNAIHVFGRCWDRFPACCFPQSLQKNFCRIQIALRLSPSKSYTIGNALQSQMTATRNKPHGNPRQKWAILKRCHLYHMRDLYS